jgi:hypothetical protein
VLLEELSQYFETQKFMASTRCHGTTRPFWIDFSRKGRKLCKYLSINPYWFFDGTKLERQYKLNVKGLLRLDYRYVRGMLRGGRF